ncbi:hypothetical protein D5S17_33775 [Pseudonocardiaceae bacterium YIM PH 21723]|nr:hypothetical protein D5S17_33775 [Pseudonocardiaceae bacterium YIM PH 21723]
MFREAFDLLEAGEPDRAAGLLTEAIAAGGDAVGYQRLLLAEVYDELQREAEADAELTEALTWFDAGIAELTREELDTLYMVADGEQRGVDLAIGRLRARQALEMLPDELDEIAEQWLDEDESGPAVSSDAMDLLFWPRAEIAEAHRLWPEADLRTDADQVMIDLEVACRQLSEAGVSRVTLVPLTVARVRESGIEPTTEEAREAYLAEFAGKAGSIAWPPGRNDACWCGSAAKYKKCCGRPGLQ